jgi:hypothetical protein
LRVCTLFYTNLQMTFVTSISVCSARMEYTSGELIVSYLTHQLEWYEEIERCILGAILHDGSKEAIDRALNLKRTFLKGLNLKCVEDYLSFDNPLTLDYVTLSKMSDEAYMCQAPLIRELAAEHDGL